MFPPVALIRTPLRTYALISVFYLLRFGEFRLQNPIVALASYGHSRFSIVTSRSIAGGLIEDLRGENPINQISNSYAVNTSLVAWRNTDHSSFNS
jgi:hypothetical protein